MKKVTKLWDCIVVTVTLATLFLGTSAMVIGGIFFLFYFLAIRPQWKKVPHDRPILKEDLNYQGDPEMKPGDVMPDSSTFGAYTQDTGSISVSIERRFGKS